jgi:hypothetical protein
MGEGDDASLGAAADGAGVVEVGGDGVAAGEDEAAEGLQLLVEAVDPRLEGGDGGVVDAGADGLALRDALLDVGGGELAADVEEGGLDGGEPASEVVVLDGGGDDAEDGVELVDGAVGLEAGVVLGDARSAEEAGLAGVTGAGVDLRVAQGAPPEFAAADARR